MNPLLAEISGHKFQIEHLLSMKERNLVPHALLFSGPQAVGKRTVARAFAAELFGADEHCIKLIDAGNYPDLHFVTREEDKKDITVESIRTLSNTLALKPYSSPCSVAIIDNAHLMNKAAANALLKTLEEPNPQTYLILVAHLPHRLMETIISRCQTIYFGFLKDEQLSSVISKLAPSELVAKLLNITEGSLEALALDNFINTKTLKVNDKKALTTYLKEIHSQVSSLKKKLKKLNEDSSYSLSLSLASELASDKENTNLNWQAIIQEKRLELLEEPTELNANSLLQALEASALIKERNLNPALQLSSLFLKK